MRKGYFFLVLPSIGTRPHIMDDIDSLTSRTLTPLIFYFSARQTSSISVQFPHPIKKVWYSTINVTFTMTSSSDKNVTFLVSRWSGFACPTIHETVCPYSTRFIY
jgi:hypothetical protein